MKKKTFAPGAMLNPVPAVMVSCGDINGEYNVLTIAWTGIVNSKPPMTYISVRPERYSHDIIKNSGEFVINLTTEQLTRATDYCGVRSGRDENKFKTQNLTPVPADNVKCPMIDESPVNIECRVTEVKELGSHNMFMAEILAVHVDESLIDNKGRIALEKAGLISFSHGEYFALRKSPLGRFGYSVMKKKTRKRIAAEKRSRK